jgi:integrase
MLSFFLTTEMKCVVVVAKDRLGFETRRIEPTWETKGTLDKLFAALRSFYEVLRIRSEYSYANPMEGNDARNLIEKERGRLIAEFIQENSRRPMHPDSGVDYIKIARTSAAYFRLRGDQWLPDIIDEPSLFNSVITAGEKWGWSLREMALARVLFDTGCRIHEACALTLADWQVSGFQRELHAINKGSHGRKVKRLFVTDRTVKILQRYVDECRSAVDPQKRRLSKLQSLSKEELETCPLFLSRSERALQPDHFRRSYWTPALESAGLKIRLHQVRHWFVTMALNDIHRRATSDENLLHLRSELRELMAWRTDMLPTYDQAVRRHNLPELANAIHLRLEIEHERALARIKADEALKGGKPVSEIRSVSQSLLDEMLKNAT